MLFKTSLKSISQKVKTKKKIVMSLKITYLNNY